MKKTYFWELNCVNQSLHFSENSFLIIGLISSFKYILNNTYQDENWYVIMKVSQNFGLYSLHIDNFY